MQIYKIDINSKHFHYVIGSPSSLSKIEITYDTSLLSSQD